MGTIPILASIWEKTFAGMPLPILLCGLAGVIALTVLLAVVLLWLYPYRLTLYLGDGSVVSERHAGNRLVELYTPELRKGYVFVGWFTDADCTDPVQKVFRMPRGGAKLYAKWAPTAGKIKNDAPMPVTPELDPFQSQHIENIYSSKNNDYSDETDEEEYTHALITTAAGKRIFVRYRRSFSARLIQAEEETKQLYNGIRSAILSYIGVKERVSWHYDSFFVGRMQFAKIVVNAKSLNLFLALDPNCLNDRRYRFQNVYERKKYRNVPVRCKIFNARSYQNAQELLELLAAKNGLHYSRVEAMQPIAFEDRDALIARGLIQVYARRETGETVSARQLKNLVAEGAAIESMSSYFVVDRITMTEAELLLNDSEARRIFAMSDTYEVPISSASRALVNLDTISENYQAGDRVDLQSLREKGLIDRNAAGCKILARGILDKSLTVEANDFSLAAVKMIALTGGRVIKIRRAK